MARSRTGAAIAAALKARNRRRRCFGLWMARGPELLIARSPYHERQLSSSTPSAVSVFGSVSPDCTAKALLRPAPPSPIRRPSSRGRAGRGGVCRRGRAGVAAWSPRGSAERSGLCDLHLRLDGQPKGIAYPREYLPISCAPANEVYGLRADDVVFQARLARPSTSPWKRWGALSCRRHLVGR